MKNESFSRRMFINHLKNLLRFNKRQSNCEKSKKLLSTIISLCFCHQNITSMKISELETLSIRFKDIAKQIRDINDKDFDLFEISFETYLISVVFDAVIDWKKANELT